MHVDVKKLGNISDGGAWRHVGRRQGERNRAAAPGKPKGTWHTPKLGYAFVHTVIDGHSRVAYIQVHDDETAVTAVAVLHRPVDWFAERGVTIERVVSDSGRSCRSLLWPDPRGAPADWLHQDNEHRPGTACGNRPPISRSMNVSGQCT